MFGLQEIVFAAMELLQLCRNGGRTRGFLLEEVLPATLPPRIQDGCRTFRRLHVQKPPRTHRFGGLAFSNVPADSFILRSWADHVSCPAGRVVGVAYLQGVSAHLPHLWNTSATVCSASMDGTVRAWNIQTVSAMYHMHIFSSYL